MRIKLLICLSFLVAVLYITGCSRNGAGTNKPKANTTDFICYSKSVDDSLYISVQLPLTYKDNPHKKFPVVVLTDANFYFPILAPIIHQYEKGNLMQPVILVGIGYKSFEVMDSLRVRDYLYPASIPSDEMKAPGGGLNYYQFIVHELLPKIDSTYRTQTNNRTLLGHSFGGYFSILALKEQLKEKRNDFKGFISASPSLWYNNNYLYSLAHELKNAALTDSLNIFLSAGALETPRQWTIKPVLYFSRQLTNDHAGKLKLSSVIYNDLDHMDVGLISFVTGIEKMYSTPVK